MTTTTPTGQAATGSRAPVRAPAALPASRPRRRPAMIGAAIALIVVGGLATWWLVAAQSSTSRIFVVAHEVAAGEQLTADDVRVATVSLDAGLTPIAADTPEKVVGSYATVRLLPGTTLTAGSISSTRPTPQGSSLVGVSLAPGQLPGTGLQSGDVVDVVATPPQQADVPDEAPSSVAATVVAVDPVPDTDRIVVTLALQGGDAKQAAAINATGRIALVLVQPA